MASKFENELSRRIRSINARITTVQRIYGKDSSIFKRIQSTIRKAGGKSSRFTKKMFSGSLRDLSKAENALRTIENSKYLTKAGRAQIGLKARETFGLRSLEKGYDETQIIKMFDVFKHSARFNRLSEFGVSSEVIVDAIMSAFEIDGEMSGKEMADFLDNNISSFIENIKGRTADEKTTEFLSQFWDSII